MLSRTGLFHYWNGYKIIGQLQVRITKLISPAVQQVLIRLGGSHPLLCHQLDHAEVILNVQHLATQLPLPHLLLKSKLSMAIRNISRLKH
jgi:hypothetical protein